MILYIKYYKTIPLNPLGPPIEAPSLFAKVLISVDGTILAWEQPDSTNPYMLDNKVSHNGKNWVSIVDNNVWEPGVYGWEEI